MGWRVLGDEEGTAEFLAADTGATEKGLHPRMMGRGEARCVAHEKGVIDVYASGRKLKVQRDEQKYTRRVQCTKGQREDLQI